jgi:hypothetical protein
MNRLLVIALVVTGCGGVALPSGLATTAPGITPPATIAPTRTPPDVEPTDTVTIDPTPEPTGPTQYKPGDVVSLTQDGADWATIVVSKVSAKARYDGAYNYDDVPAKGHVYLQAYVTYTALADGVDYNPFDWQVFVGDVASDGSTFVSNGPEPQLSSGTLPKGRKAAGWVVYEVATTGKVLMSYGNTFSNDAPVFEIVLRAK